MTEQIRCHSLVYGQVRCQRFASGPVSYTHLDVYKRQVLFTADTAAIFTDGYIGITEATSLLFGDVLADWRKKGLNALLLP